MLRAHKHYDAWKEGAGVSEQPEYDTEQFGEYVDVPALPLSVFQESKRALPIIKGRCSHSYFPRMESRVLSLSSFGAFSS